MMDVAKIFDVFFNGRPADDSVAKPSVTIGELIKRKSSVVSIGGKLYRVTCEEIDHSCLKVKP